MGKSKATVSNNCNVSRDISEEVAAAVEKALQSPTLLQSPANILVELVGQKLQESMQFNNDLVVGLKKELEEKHEEVRALKQELQDRTDQLEQYTRRNSLRIFGLEERDGENTDQLALSVAQKLSVPLSLSDIDRCHRVGPKINGRKRPIIVKFVSYRKRREVFRAKRLLKGSGITIREDLTRHRLELLQAAIEKFGLKSVWTEDGTVIVRQGNSRLRLQTMADLFFPEICNDITMTVNLDKHRDNLLSAWKDVLDDKTATNWALFGYEGQTNDLKVVSKGSGGIEEMVEDLNSGKIMYAFCRILDPKTSLPKCVLINWQGEGAPLVRKGTCANHVRDVARFFKGTHLTLNARNEEEVDPQLIIDKVAKSTGSAYSFKERADNDVAQTAPIGTSYKKVVPTQEINSMERDKFWEKEEKEEKQRQEEERKRKEEERLRLEMERRQREVTEAKLREERAQEHNRNINQLREAERSAENNLHSPVSADDELAEREREERERKGRSELLRRQRSQEAQAVISQRTIDARAVFEQNTSAGQMHNRRKASLSMSVLPEDQLADIPEPTIEKHPTSVSKNTDIPQEEQFNVSSSQVPAGNTQNTNVNVTANISQASMQNENTDDPLLQSDDVLLFDTPALGSDLGLKARALYDYQAADPTEITFDPGDIITHIDQIDEGWWQGLGPDGTFGLFPANYVELIE